MRWLDRFPRAVLLGCFAVSGVAGLVDQLVWTRWLGLVTGSFATATALVIAVFMAGIGAGNAWAGRRAGGLTARDGLRGYAAAEAALAVFALLSIVVFPAAPAWRAALGPLVGHRAAATGVCLLLLLPPTFLMGATLPLMIRGYAGGAGGLGALYGTNTLGAAAGPLIAAFALIPSLGLRGTAGVAALLNAVAAGGAWLVAGRRAHHDEATTSPDRLTTDDPPVSPLPPSPFFQSPYLLAFLSGLLALGFEIALARLLILTVTGLSVYGLAINLAAFLAGLGAGALWLARRPPTGRAGALAAFAASLAIAWAFTLTLPLWDRLPLLLLDLWRLPLPPGALALARFGLAFALVGVVAAGFGYALPALAAALPPGPAPAGRLFAMNTAGAVAGALGTGFLLLPVLGLERTLPVLGSAALATALAALLPGLRPAGRIACAVLAPLGLALPFLLPPPDRALMNAATHMRPHRFDTGTNGGTPAEMISAMGTIVHQEDSPTGRIAIRRTGSHVALVVNGKPDASTTARDAVTMMLIAHLPLALHPRPREALIVGLGGGLTLTSMLSHPVEHVTCVEISPATVRAARWFQVWTGPSLSDPRARIVLDDARHWIGVTDRRWDIIVSEPSNLFVAGTVHLYTREYYELCRGRLAPGGLFIQWTHYYGMSVEDCRTVVRTAAASFPHAIVFVQPGGDFFILGANDPVTLDLARARARVAVPNARMDLGRIDVHSAEALLGHALWTREEALRWAGAGPVCTDDRPILEFSTPLTRDRPETTDANRRVFLSWGPLTPLPLAGGANDRLALAREQERLGALERAATELRETIRLDPKLKEAWWRLGRIESWLGRADDARATLRTGLAKAGAYAPASQLLRELGTR